MFGSQELDIWIWVSEFGYLGWGLRLWISAFRCLVLVLRGLISKFESEDLNLWVWVLGYGCQCLDV